VRNPPPPALLETARNGLVELGVASGRLEDLAGAFASLAVLVDSWGATLRLTGHRGADAILRRLVLDGAALALVLPDVPTAADLGSGAGFPGLPLSLLRPTCAVTLVEARERAHHFQRAALRALQLQNVTTLRGRAEVLEPRPQHLVVAQAVAPPAEVVGWMRRWARIGGLLAIPASAEMPHVPAIPGIEPLGPLPYRVPLGGPERLLWTGRVLEPTPPR
jgi:16S rRNA (guanine527-N7)-methyltransferase